MTSEYDRIRREQADWFGEWASDREHVEALKEAVRSANKRSRNEKAETKPKSEPRELNERIPERKPPRKAELEMWMGADQRRCHVRFRGQDLLDETGKRADVSDTLDRFKGKSAFEYFERVAANFRKLF